MLTCDADAAGVERAVVVVVNAERTQELHFCHHHYTQHEWSLVEAGWTVRLDTREELVSRT